MEKTKKIDSLRRADRCPPVQSGGNGTKADMNFFVIKSQWIDASKRTSESTAWQLCSKQKIGLFARSRSKVGRIVCSASCYSNLTRCRFEAPCLDILSDPSLQFQEVDWK